MAKKKRRSKYVEEHITWLKGNEFLLVSGLKRKPNARDREEAKEELKSVRSVLRKLRS